MRKSKKRLFAMLLAVSMVLPNVSSVRAEDISTPGDADMVTEAPSEEVGTEDVEYVILDGDGNVVKGSEEILSSESSEGVSPEDVTEGTDEPEMAEEMPSEDSSKDATEGVTEDVTEDVQSTEKVTTEEQNEKTEEKVPTFTSLLDGVNVSGIDFSSKELLIGTDDASVFTWDTTVVSEYNGVYLTRYNSVEETKNAYSYYINKVDYVSPNIEFSVQDNEDEEGADLSQMNQGDDAFSNLNDMDAVSVPSKTIALIDTGVNASDLVGSVSVIGDDTSDDNGHGTRMYGYIKDEYPDAKILSIKAMDASGKGKASDVCAAIMYAIESDVDIINLSISAFSTKDNEVVRNIIEEAIASGITVVGAAGNDGKNVKYFIPGAISDAVIVGACDEAGRRLSASNYGATVNFNLVSESTSEAAARMSGIIASNNGESKIKIYSADFDADSIDGEMFAYENGDFVVAATWKDGVLTHDTAYYVLRGATYNGHVPFIYYSNNTWFDPGKDDAGNNMYWSYGGYNVNCICIDDSLSRGVDGFTFDITYSNMGNDEFKRVVYYAVKNYGYLDTHNIVCRYLASSRTTNASVGNMQLSDGKYADTVIATAKATAIPSNITFNTWYLDNDDKDAGESGRYQSFLTWRATETPKNAYYIAIKKVDSKDRSMMGVTFNLSFKDNDANATRTVTVKGNGATSYDGIWTGYYGVVDTAGTHIGGYTTTAPGDISVPHGVAVIKLGDFTNAPTNISVTENWNTTNYTGDGQWKGGNARLYTGDSYVVVNAANYNSNTSVKNPTVYTSIQTAINNAGSYTFKNEIKDTYYIAIKKTDDTGKDMMGVTFNLNFKDNDANATRTITVNGNGATDYDGIWTGYYGAVNTEGTHIGGYTTTAPGDISVPHGVAVIKLGSFANAPTNISVTENWNTTNYTGNGQWSKGNARLYTGNSYVVVNAANYTSNTSVKNPTAYTSVQTAINNAGSFTYTNTPKRYVGIYKKDRNGNSIQATFEIYGTNTSGTTTGGTKVGTITTSSTTGKASYEVTSVYNAASANVSGKYKYFYAHETATSSGHYIGLPDKVLTVHERELANADYIEWYNPDTVFAYLTKSSANTSYTSGNPNYDLTGAEYKVFKTRNAAQAALNSNSYTGAIATLTVQNNTDGKTNTINLSAHMNKNSTTGLFENTVFFVVESKAGKNYLRSTDVYSITVTGANTSSNPAHISVTDEPVNDPFNIEIIKTDKLTGSNKIPEGKTLAGAKFRIDFYAVDITQTYTQTQLETTYANKKVAEYTKTITVAKDDTTGQYYADLGETFPLGYITITETTPPADYSLVDAVVYLQNDKTKNITGNLAFVMSTQITNNGTDSEPVEYHPSYPTINLAGSTGAAFNITDENTPIRGNLNLTKVRLSDEGPIANVEFEIENNATGEKHSIYTDANGNATTANNSNAWFGLLDDGTTVAYKTGYGCLPAGTYTVTEKRSDANKDYQLLAPITVNITSTDTVTVAQADGKLYNVEKPRIETTASDKATDSKTLPQLGEPQTVVDVIRYYNLRANSTYYIVGTLMIKHADGTYEPYMKDGKAYTVTSSAIKTAATWTKSEFEKNGSYTMEFPGVIPEGHEGECFVVFQKLYYKSVPANDDNAQQYAEYDGTTEKIFPIVHEDITNADQTVKPADIHTTAKDKVTNDHISQATGTVTITDRVNYTGLTMNETYTIKGELHVTGYTWKDKDGNVIKTVDANDKLLDEEGNPIVASKTFKATASDGYVDLEFTYDASLLNGESVVAFEDLYYKEKKIAFHADIEDEDETIHYPNIHTTLFRGGCAEWSDDFDEDDITKETTVDGSSQELKAEENAVVVDRIKYHNLLANRNYVIRGVLMDKETEEEFVDADGNKVKVEYLFTTPSVDPVNVTTTPNSSLFICEDGTKLDMSADHADYLVDGYADVEFPAFNAKGMEGKTLVAYEEIVLIQDDDTEIIVATHKDIDDVDQTVRFPRIHTNANVEETKTTLVPIDGPVTINDTVTYENLIPGKTYTLTARPVVKGDKTGTYKDGEPLLDKNGNEVTKTFDFVAEDVTGEVVVPITFDGYLLPIIDIVCYENLDNDKGLDIAAHNDIDDEDQTTVVCDISTTARSTDTGESDTLASEETVIIDKVAYERLVPGITYRLYGTLMIKSANEPVMVDGQPVTTMKEFTPDAAEGNEEMTFPAFDAVDLALAGEDIVVFEELYVVTVDENGDEGEVKVAEHKDIEDDDQTIHLADIPKTTAEDSETEDHIADVDEDVTIVDHVEYKNLLIGKEYTVKGILMVKETGEPLLVDGEQVTGETVFTPETRNGVVDVVFTFDGSALEGQTVVVFEDFYREGIHVATHADIDDEDQSVRFPKVKTKSEDAVTKENIGEAGVETTIIDTVSYWNLIPGKEYTVKGVLMLKETGEPLLVDGEKVTAETTFTADEADGTVEVVFTFNSSLLAGQTIIVFEDVYYNGIHVGTHSDITDEDQSEHHPGIKTRATDRNTGEQVGYADKTVTIVDEVSYTNLIVGKKYTVKGTLMDRDTGSVFLVDGKPVTAEKTFTAEKPDGVVELEFTFDGSALRGTVIVVFEDLFYKGKRVATHADLTDKDQTVYYPAVQTHVEDQTKRVQPVENVTVVDDVMYSKLKIGERYQLVGVLVDKKTGKNIVVDNTPIKATKVFTAEAEDGMITMEFHFDATGLEGDVTVFEYLSLVKDVDNKDLNYYLVAEHTDLNDTEQTFVISPVPKTGDDTPVNILFGLLLLSGLGLAYILFKKRRLNF